MQHKINKSIFLITTLCLTQPSFGGIDSVLDLKCNLDCSELFAVVKVENKYINGITSKKIENIYINKNDQISKIEGDQKEQIAHWSINNDAIYASNKNNIIKIRRNDWEYDIIYSSPDNKKVFFPKTEENFIYFSQAKYENLPLRNPSQERVLLKLNIKTKETTMLLNGATSYSINQPWITEQNKLCIGAVGLTMANQNSAFNSTNKCSTYCFSNEHLINNNLNKKDIENSSICNISHSIMEAPTGSTDGKYIAYYSYNDKDHGWSLLDLKTQKIKKYIPTSTHVDQMVVSPNGLYIAYIEPIDPFVYRIKIENIENGGIIKIFNFDLNKLPTIKLKLRNHT